MLLYLIAAGSVVVATGILWALFVGGQLFNILIRASFAKRNPVNPVSSMGTYVKANWDILLIRGIAGVFLFWVWSAYPDLFTKIANGVGIHWNMTVPLIPPVAFFGGVASDTILDYIISKVPGLQKQIPGLAAPPPPYGPVIDAKEKQNDLAGH